MLNDMFQKIGYVLDDNLDGKLNFEEFQEVFPLLRIVMVMHGSNMIKALFSLYCNMLKQENDEEHFKVNESLFKRKSKIQDWQNSASGSLATRVTPTKSAQTTPPAALSRTSSFPQVELPELERILQNDRAKIASQNRGIEDKIKNLQP